jgi:beta-lactamase regulating signal transducer with metallopeptidase domain
MIPALTFSLIAAALVFLAGRKDAARDPRLTVLLLVLLGMIPLLAALLPEIRVLPSHGGAAGAPGLSWTDHLPAIWATGFVLALVRLSHAALVLHRCRKRAVEVDRIDGVAICELPGLQGPVAAGIWNPAILVPASWQAWPAEHQHIVLAHELAHHHRRDPLWRLMAELACAVHWYHPLARWMKRRFIMQCEFACDARVLAKGIDPKAYASVLCDFAGQGSPSPLAPAMAETGPLESRVRRMLQPPGGLSGRTLTILALLGVLTACSLSMISREDRESADIPAAEVELRWTANPFPAEP